MNPIKIVKKLYKLGKKLNNPPFFSYSVYHYLKKDVPIKCAEKIRNANIKTYRSEEKDLIISTYDGSNQSVHPDVLFYKENYWLVLTPYPYGMEEYENPSLYFGTSIYLLSALHYNPIDRQRKHEIGFHLSDPCIFEYKNELVCAYRENTRENGIESSFIYCRTMKEAGIWSERRLIADSVDDPLLSPAFYVVKEGEHEIIHMIHVKRMGNDSCLIHSILDEQFEIQRYTVQKCEGLSDDYYVWHIGVSFNLGRKIGNQKERRQALLLIRNKTLPQKFRLFTALSSLEDIWTMDKEILPPDEIKRIESHPYKSCFVPNSQSVLYSYIDKRNRYRMSEIPLKVD